MRPRTEQAIVQKLTTRGIEVSDIRLALKTAFYGDGIATKNIMLRKAHDEIDRLTAERDELAAFAKEFIAAATVDMSIVKSPRFESDDLTWLVKKARSLSHGSSSNG